VTRQQINDKVEQRLQEQITDANTVVEDVEKSFTDWFQSQYQGALVSMQQSQPAPQGGGGGEQAGSQLVPSPQGGGGQAGAA